VDLTSLSVVKKLLKEHDVHPSKRLGQNFLINKHALGKLVDAADIKQGDTVLEVGAGFGTITLEVAKRAKRVVAVEKDRALIPLLKEATRGFDNIEIVNGDILKLTTDGESVVSGQWSVVGNIPYYLTANLIRKLLESQNPPKSMTLMVQKEVAQRICAEPPRMSILSVSVQIYARPNIVGFVSRSSFWPKPKVDSAIITIVPISTNSNIATHEFFKIVRAGFSSPRKQLLNNLTKAFSIPKNEVEDWLLSADIDPKRRAETLQVGEWRSLNELSPL